MSIPIAATSTAAVPTITRRRAIRARRTPGGALARLREIAGWIVRGEAPAHFDADAIEARALEAMAEGIPGADCDAVGYECGDTLLVRVPGHLSPDGEPLFFVLGPGQIARD